MNNLGMGRSRKLTRENIDRFVKQGQIGNYALGYVEAGTFYVCYVGRSDTDLNLRLKDHLDENPDYECFKFKYAATVIDAYEMECRNYHDFPNSNNIIHPVKPKGYTNKCNCPVCKR